jgi:uncharacterized protein YprB with RNaseH-like and TPR domain
MILYLDLETIPCGEKLARTDFHPPGNYTKPETIAKWYEENATGMVEKEYINRSLISYKCQVICLGYALDDDKVVVLGGNEKDIFDRFEAILQPFSDRIMGTTVVGFNLKFDLPIIRQRAMKWNLPLIKRLPYGRNDKQAFDLMVEFMKPSTDFVSCTEVCKFFGIEDNDDSTGADVYNFYLDGELDKIYDHCRMDIEKNRNIHKKMI